MFDLELDNRVSRIDVPGRDSRGFNCAHSGVFFQMVCTAVLLALLIAMTFVATAIESFVRCTNAGIGAVQRFSYGWKM